MARSNVLTTAFRSGCAGAVKLPTSFAGPIAGATGIVGGSATASGDTADRWHMTCKVQANVRTRSFHFPLERLNAAA
jgi:hypothetical protein